jgi:hypothetical protein
VQLKSANSALNGLPHGSVDFTDQTAGLGGWGIEVRSDELGGLAATLRNDGGANKIYRLKSDLIADLLVVCHFAVA